MAQVNKSSGPTNLYLFIFNLIILFPQNTKANLEFYFVFKIKKTDK